MKWSDATVKDTNSSRAGFIADFVRLDNEVSKKLIEHIKDDELKYQLAAPYNHRRKPAECAIGTFKNHFISIQVGTDKYFPSEQRYELLEHAEITFAMSRPSRLNPKVSAYTFTHGTFDFNRTPVATYSGQENNCSKYCR